MYELSPFGFFPDLIFLSMQIIKHPSSISTIYKDPLSFPPLFYIWVTHFHLLHHTQTSIPEMEKQ